VIDVLDLVIRNGTVVTAGSTGACDVGMHDGMVVQLGGVMRGRREIDAQGLYVLPGGVDIHVHLTSPIDGTPGVEIRPDDFYSGSLAAIAGGVTTVGNMTFQRKGESLRAALARDLDAARREAAVDYVLHPVLTDPTEAAIAEIPGLAAEGHTSLKVFMVMEVFDARVDAYLDALHAAARSGMMTMVHCEDGAIIRCVCRDLLAQGRGTARHYPDSRPAYSETASVERAVGMARATGAPIYVVHLSSGDALDACRRARAAGVAVYVETRPVYLYLTRELFERPDGARYAGAPPLREPTDVRALWAGLWSGDIHTFCSDHAPWTLAQKLDPALDVSTLRQGVADLETLMPMLFSEGVRKGRLSIERFVALTATNVAKLFGLYPQKGTIAIGSDADLAIWDPGARRTLDGVAMRSRAGYSAYDGWEVVGWPVYTVSRGEVVFERGMPIATRGRGRWVRRRPAGRP
jgi:dihydropyrimidinase